MDLDAIRALSRERDGDSNQLLHFTGIAPSAMAALSKAQKAFITCGARPSIFFSLARFSLLYICVIVVRGKAVLLHPVEAVWFRPGVYLGSVARPPVEFICFDASDWSEELSALISCLRSWIERLAQRSPPPEPR